MSVELLNCDCMEYMKGCADNSFDLAIVDPPYGKKPTRNSDGAGVCKRTFGRGSDKWDVRPDAEYFIEIFRVSKNQIIWGGNYFIDFLRPTNSFIVWDKEKDLPVFADCELAWTSFTSVARIFKYKWHGMIQGDMQNKEKRIHPTQKPRALYDWLLLNYAKPDHRILDTHLGSGSSAIAAHYFGCDFVGMEIDKDYYDAACERFDRETRQIGMGF